MLDLRNITKIYRTAEIETLAVRDVSLRLERGDFVAVMGPSGGGKSTLLNLVGLLDQADEGQYIFLGNNVRELTDHALSRLRSRHVGFVFQNFNLIESLSVQENIELPLQYQDVPRSTRKERVAEVLDRVSLSHRKKHFPAHLSGGQQQRVAIARAIVGNPEILLADEPTGNLDSSNGAEVMRLLGQLNAAGTTILMVTHSLEHARRAREIADMRDGVLRKHECGSIY
jgi:putative ABC transport system ATP-binding protein